MNLYPDVLFNKELEMVINQVGELLTEENLKELPGCVIVSMKDSESSDDVIKRTFMTISMDSPLVQIAFKACDNDRHQVMYMLGKTCPYSGIDAVFTVHEAWIGSNIAVKPSDDPNRKEVFMFAGLTLDKRVNMAIYNIDRNSNDERILLGSRMNFVEFNGKNEVTAKAPLLEAFLDGYFERGSIETKEESKKADDIMSKVFNS